MAPTTSIRLGLDAIRGACAVLGHPQLATPAVLVGGTNGKGSTAMMLESIGRAAGLRVGLFHSPPLDGEEWEQIRLDGSAVDAATYAALHGDVDAAAEESGQPLTAFESLTAVAYLAFSRAELDLAVVEVGLGGARDATNIAEPAVSVLTTVDFDHMAYLGDTLSAIAREKAGIFRPRRSAVIGFLRGPALRAARREAEAIGARCLTARSHVRDLSLRDGWLELGTRRTTYRAPLPLIGDHQARNAALAILASEALRPRLPAIDRAAILRGLSEVRCPGRLETITKDGHDFLLDVAHNPAAARSLVEHLAASGRRPDLLFGAFRDKEVQGMLEILRPQVGRLLLTPIDHPRSWSPAHMASAFGGETVASPGDGLAEARPDTPLLVSGSMRLVGDVRRILLEPATPTRHAALG
ncbi:MAG: folylpolyglutamate synthase/dihydrofolate synthase family protein [Acidobacteriota bacterium]